MEAIVLAGGYGTRLALVLEGIPKVLAPVGGRPFLELLLKLLKQKGMERVILSVGYMASNIRDHFGDSFDGLEIAYSVEEEPLGTGGAVVKALKMASTDPVFVMNGDTFVDVDYAEMLARHVDAGAPVSIAVAQVPDCTRFGRVVIEQEHVAGYTEKGYSGPGVISAGTYVMKRDVFAPFDLPTAFSLEMGFFARYMRQLHPLAFPTSGGFIDIGIPEDLARAQTELQ
jgi:D-glycero-alpha-D-manno-heptose 1-phosphate guanylyltransferase